MWSLFSRTSSFPYEILDVISEDQRNIWKLHRGKKKQNGDEVSIFVCEGSAITIDLAKSSVKRLKMFKHPSVLKFIDSCESEKSVYLVTEFVTPVLKWISSIKSESNVSFGNNLAGWGLLQINQALSFMNNDAKLTHNNINVNSIYVTQGGEWKLFGFEYTTADDSYFPNKIQPQLSVYNPPEINAPTKPKCHLWSFDVWGFGCLIWEVFNGDFLGKSMDLQHTIKIPKSLIPTYCELVGANPLSRPNSNDVLERLSKRGQIYHNDLTDTLTFLDEIQIKSDSEKHRFFSDLTAKLDSIPQFISKNKILPALLTAHEILNVGSVLLTPIFKVGHILEEAEYQSQIVPCVVKMFSSTDRATRLKLLKEMESLATHLDSKTVNDQIFQPLTSGFLDTNPTIREHTIKAVLFLAAKMNSNNLNVEILKHFARLQSKDDQGGIRTNTTVCLGKIASFLSPDTRQKCLVSAFTRAMRDPFPPARIAGVTAIAATQQFYPLLDVASKIMPVLSHLTLDPEKMVRDAVFKVMKGFLGKLEKVSEDPHLKEVMEKEVANASSSVSSTWAGWAVGALASKFYKGPSAQNPQANKDGSVSSADANTNNTALNEKKGASLSSNAPERVPPSASTWDDNRKNDKGLTARTDILHDNSSNETEIEDIGDGWGDDDDEWGSLESADINLVESADQDQKSGLSSTSLISWADPPGNDFFSSFETAKPSTNVRKQTNANMNQTSSWETWDDNFSVNDPKKQEREEKKQQRQREIEAKRTARSGPMKLGTKKF